MAVVTKEKNGSDKAVEKVMHEKSSEKTNEKPEKASKAAAESVHGDESLKHASPERTKALGWLLIPSRSNMATVPSCGWAICVKPASK